MFGRSNKLRFQAAEYKSSDRLLKRRFGRETSFRWLCGEDSQETALFTLTRSPLMQKCRAQRRKDAEDMLTGRSCIADPQSKKIICTAQNMSEENSASLRLCARLHQHPSLTQSIFCCEPLCTFSTDAKRPRAETQRRKDAEDMLTGRSCTSGSSIKENHLQRTKHERGKLCVFAALRAAPSASEPNAEYFLLSLIHI